MLNRRALHRGLAAAFLSLALLAGPLAPLPARAAQVASAELQPSIPEGFQLAAENTTFQLYANPTLVTFKVVDKRSGYVWSSNLDATTPEDKLNKIWTAFATSGVSIDYLDKKAIDKRVSLANSAHTVDYKAIDKGFQATVTFTDVGIALTVSVVLEDSGVRVDVPAASIVQSNPDFKLGVLHLFPFFAATREDAVPGYMFIPDGSGSLIRFAATTKAKNIYYGRYYGRDLGMVGAFPWDPFVRAAYDIQLPVVGMVHEEKKNAYLAIVEHGTTYGEIQAHPAGVTTRFNFLYNAFVYNESYFQATNRAGAGVTTLQRRTNSFDITLHYRFLTGEASDYVGMARDYQRYLLEKGELKQVVGDSPDIGIRLEFLGGEKERVLLWDRFIPMTTIGQMGDILEDLNLPNPEVVYYGWQPFGASAMPPDHLAVDSGLGSVSQLKTLKESVEAAGGHLSLYYNPQAAFQNEGGYSPRNDLAMAITNVNLLGYNRGEPLYFFNADTVSRRFTSLSQSVYDELGGGLALNSIGSMVYSDFKSGQELNREGVRQRYRDLLAGSTTRLTFFTPADYAFGSMSAFFDIPLDDSGYLYTSEAVPFVQIVLAGYVPYYGPAMNFSSDTQEDLLRHVDYGVYPAYFLTQDVTAKILNTHSNWIYTSSYAQWSTQIKDTYAWVNKILGPVRGATIEARQMLATGVYATTYSNGKQVIVNYNRNAYQGDGVTVNAQDALLREVRP